MTSPTHTSQYIVISIDDQLYGMAMTSAHEIMTVPALTRPAGAPYEVMGLIELQNKIVPVISLRHLFDLGGAELDDRARIIIVSIDGNYAALLVDEVIQISEYRELLPTRSGWNNSGYIMGYAKQGEQGETSLVGILHMDRILSFIYN
ncbi:chemotaxis protein CheW [Paenibacillus massiliensis]|uniref:chemotaxis protein CheW n=1 Tax=Paenibacillus massiliensis TaxID=225917 RepID=UPI000400C870|nr:chemotaxis protein CheW [Paenibacillus massiliensis]